MWMKALRYTCRTAHPAEADLFFVPVMNEKDGIVTYRKGNKGFRDIMCPPGSLWFKKACRRSALVELVEQVRDERSNPSYLSRRGGADHILFTPREGTLTDSHPYADVDFYDRAWGNATRLAVEEGASKYDWPVERFLPQRFFHAMPLASFVHAAGHHGWPTLPWRLPHRRPLLVASASNLHHSGSKIGGSGRSVTGQMNALRDALFESCRRAANSSRCSHLHLSTGDSANYAKTRQEFALIPRIGTLYWNSVFCLQPVGDCCTRKGMIDSMLLGCIPVYFHSCLRQQWPWHWGGWMERATVFIDMQAVLNGSVDVVSALEQVSARKIARMQQTIAERAHCMHYFEPPMSRQIEQGLLMSMKPDLSSNDFSQHAGPAAFDQGGNAEHAGVEWLLSDRSMLNSQNDAFDIVLQGSWALSRVDRQMGGGGGQHAAAGVGNDWPGVRMCQRVPWRDSFD